mgnify:CR=1 FL=1
MNNYFRDTLNDSQKSKINFFIAMLSVRDDYLQNMHLPKTVCLAVEGATDRDFFTDYCNRIPQPKYDFLVDIPKHYPTILHYVIRQNAETDDNCDLDVCLLCEAYLEKKDDLDCLEVIGIIDKDFLLEEDDHYSELSNVYRTDTNDLETLMMATNPDCLFSAIAFGVIPNLTLLEAKTKFIDKAMIAATSAYRLSLLNGLENDLQNDKSGLESLRSFNVALFFKGARENYKEAISQDDADLIHSWVDSGAYSKYFQNAVGDQKTFSQEDADALVDEIRFLLKKKEYSFGLDSYGKWKDASSLNGLCFSLTSPLNERIEFWSLCRGHSFIQFFKKTSAEIEAEFPYPQNNELDRNLEFAMIHAYDMSSNWSLFSQTELGSTILSLVERPA